MQKILYPLQLYKKAYSGLSAENWYLAIVMFVNRSGTMVMPFMTLYCREVLGFTIPQAALIVCMFGLGSLTGSFFGGFLTDRFGSYYVQLTTLILGGILFIVLGSFTNFTALAAGSFILSSFNDGFRPANLSAVAFYSSKNNLTRSTSLNRLAVNFGWAIGGLVGGWFAGINYHLLFWVDGCTNILAALLLMRLLPVNSGFTVCRKNDKSKVKTSPLGDHIFMIFIFLATLFSICFFNIFTMEPLFYRTRWLFSEFWIGLLMGINGLLIVIFEMVLVMVLETRIRPSICVATGVLFAGLGYASLDLLPPDHASAILILLLLTIGEMLSLPFMNMFWVSRTNVGNIGRYSAWYASVSSLSQVLSPLVCGYIAARSGFTSLWYTAGFTCLGCAVGFLLLPWPFREIPPQGHN